MLKVSEGDEKESPPNTAIKSKDLLEIQKVSRQMEKNENVTGNFGSLNIQK